MRFEIITLFPQMFEGPFSESIIKRAKEKGLIEINFHNLRDFGDGKHKTVDDTPYGGGKGMVLKVDVLDKAISSIKSKSPKSKVILLSPQGRIYNQDIAKELTSETGLILVCGHYEGFDQRVYDLVDDVISIGDYVLTGGEIAAAAIIDSVSRLIPGVIAEESSQEESFMEKDDSGKYLIEHPHYTRPIEYKGSRIPSILISGNHAEIVKWRRENMKKRRG